MEDGVQFLSCTALPDLLLTISATIGSTYKPCFLLIKLFHSKVYGDAVVFKTTLSPNNLDRCVWIDLCFVRAWSGFNSDTGTEFSKLVIRTHPPTRNTHVMPDHYVILTPKLTS